MAQTKASIQCSESKGKKVSISRWGVKVGVTNEAKGAEEGKRKPSAQMPISLSCPGPWKNKAGHTEDNLCLWPDSGLLKGGVLVSASIPVST